MSAADPVMGYDDGVSGFVQRAGRSVKNGLRAMVLPALFLSLVIYFLWNATQGDRGLQAYALRQEQLKSVQADLAKAQADQAGWDRRVSELRNQRLDPDMLDERARAMLNLADPADIVVPYAPGKRLFSPP
jgi:cell division protein FtsB